MSTFTSPAFDKATIEEVSARIDMCGETEIEIKDWEAFYALVNSERELTGECRNFPNFKFPTGEPC